MTRLIIPALVALLMTGLTGCAAPLKVTLLDDAPSLSGQPKRLALLTRTIFDADIRLSLIQHGFKVVRSASLKRIERDTSETTREAFNKAETRFGITVHPGRAVDFCVTGPGYLLGRVVYELSDLNSNQTVLFVSAGGQTEPCGIHTDIVWDKLAKGLLENWK